MKLRTHMFAAATIHLENGPQDVRIRNLSPGGALVDGTRLPATGTRLVLRRYHLEISGQIAWQSDARAGIVFDRPIDVSHWIAAVSVPRAPVQSAVNLPRRTEGNLKPARAVTHSATADAGDVSDLRLLRIDLVGLAHVMTGETGQAGERSQLQMLNLALQRLDDLIARAEDR